MGTAILRLFIMVVVIGCTKPAPPPPVKVRSEASREADRMLDAAMDEAVRENVRQNMRD